MANIAFGTQRISVHNPQHIQALKEAIRSGITMIDTSCSYLNGDSHRAIALAFREFGDDVREQVEIVTKFDIMGKPVFEQYEDAIKDLEVEKLDCFLIENIEAFMIELIKKDTDSDDKLDEINRITYEAFLDLESLVADGKIKSYGMSAENFSQNHSSEQFIPYEDLLTLADSAADELKNETHSFTTIELPINILEQDGLLCASWAKENGLRVIANRPLNALHNDLMYRLADYSESHEYYHHLNEMLDVTDTELLKPLFNLFEQLDISKHKFGWVGDYENFLYTQALPHMQKTLKVVDEKNRDTMLNFIELFLAEYQQMVKYECSKQTNISLKKIFKECNEALQICAIKFLYTCQDVDFVAIGMRKSSYVSEILDI